MHSAGRSDQRRYGPIAGTSQSAQAVLEESNEIGNGENVFHSRAFESVRSVHDRRQQDIGTRHDSGGGRGSRTEALSECRLARGLVTGTGRARACVRVYARQRRHVRLATRSGIRLTVTVVATGESEGKADRCEDNKP